MMDRLTELITRYKIPIGRWGKQFFDFLTTYFEWFFDAISRGITSFLDGLIAGMLWLPPIATVLLVAALAYLLKLSWALTLSVILGLLFFVTITPIGLLARACGKDFLRLRLDRGAKSYWIEREPPGPPPQSMKNQF